jgi:hypothetical protein
MVQVMANQLGQAYKYIADLNVDPQLKRALRTNPTCRAVFR